MNTSEHSTTQGELEKLVSDLRGLLANKDLDVVPEIKLLRQRLDDGIHSARESAIRAAQDAARQAKDAAIAADRYALPPCRTPSRRVTNFAGSWSRTLAEQLCNMVSNGQ